MTTLRWVPPSHCIPPHRVSRPEQIITIANAFAANGWDDNQPVLIGYTLPEGLQLLSGTHRREAAVLAELPAIPVLVYPEPIIRACWGTDAWSSIMDAPLVKEFQ